MKFRKNKHEKEIKFIKIDLGIILNHVRMMEEQIDRLQTRCLEFEQKVKSSKEF